MKTLIFDLDETLVHCNESTKVPYDVKMEFTFPSGDKMEAGLNIRPHAVECLQELTKYFEIVIFTASHENYASKVLAYLDPTNQLIDHQIYRDYCILTTEGLRIKDLRIFSNRNLENLCIIDNATYSFAYQINNGVPIIPFYNSKNDDELIQIIPYLKQFLNKDIQQLNKATFKLEEYSSVNILDDAYQKIFC